MSGAVDWRGALAQLRHPLVRALAWSIGSPTVFNPALGAWQGNLTDDQAAHRWLVDAWPWLQTLDDNAAPLERWMGWPSPAPSRRPLGKTFELLIGFWLVHRPDIAWVQPGMLVKSSGRVVGEFDHVFADVAGALHTLELTVKFYIRIAPARGARGYVGPMVYDFMAEKIARMATHQMPLGDTADGQRAMRALLTRRGELVADDVVLKIHSGAIARGFLFTHWQGCDVPVPNEVGPAHLQGRWILTNDTPKVPTAQRFEWKALEGVQWLGPQRVAIAELSNLETCASLIGKERHVMVGRFAVNAELGHADEIERWMILRPDARVFSIREDDEPQ